MSPPSGSGDILFLPKRPSVSNNLKTALVLFTKFYTNINHHERTCRVQEW